MSLDLSSMSFYLSNMSLDLSNMSLDLSSISFDPCLNRRSGMAGNLFSRPVLKYLLVGNLKNFTLSIHANAFCMLCFKRESRPETQHGTGCIQDPKHNVGQVSNGNRDPKHNVGQVPNGNRDPTWDTGALGHTGLHTGPETQRGTNRHLMQTWIQRGTLKTTWGYKNG
ncbi:hypothetical protein TNCV_4339161 [Trichonephila clavipes]|nr:hypothetical protein TNCV_4339161 [Trichonephila clavipes]